MAFDERLGDRIREAVAGVPGVREKRMFGGLAFLQHGKMFVGVIGDDLMARVGKPAHAVALEQAHVRPMDFSGRPMDGYVYVAPEGVDMDVDLQRWIDQCLDFVATLPDKPA